jgi:hypothetical protein
MSAHKRYISSAIEIRFHALLCGKCTSYQHYLRVDVIKSLKIITSDLIQSRKIFTNHRAVVSPHTSVLNIKFSTRFTQNVFLYSVTFLQNYEASAVPHKIFIRLVYN